MRTPLVKPYGLRLGTPEELGLAPETVNRLGETLRTGVGVRYSGAAALVALRGVVVYYAAYGSTPAGRPLTLDARWPLGRLGAELTVRPLYWLLSEAGRLDPTRPAGRFSPLPPALAAKTLGQMPRGRFGPHGFWPAVLGQLDGRGFQAAVADRWERPLGLRLGCDRPSPAPLLPGRGPVAAALWDLGLYLHWLSGEEGFPRLASAARSDLRQPFRSGAGLRYYGHTVAFGTAGGTMAIWLGAGGGGAGAATFLSQALGLGN